MSWPSEVIVVALIKNLNKHKTNISMTYRYVDLSFQLAIYFIQTFKFLDWVNHFVATSTVFIHFNGYF